MREASNKIKRYTQMFEKALYKARTNLLQNNVFLPGKQRAITEILNQARKNKREKLLGKLGKIKIKVI